MGTVASGMSAFQLGPVVLSAPRFHAAVALAVLVLSAELVAWRRRRGEATDSGAGGVSAEKSQASGDRPNAASAAWAWKRSTAT